ncbi:recombinase family protein [Nocardia rhizosphaerihabitans]|uniref:Recombinase domain-containing protein n=1 Tax=Nocardia rhizosphaerihabitans TaxID=1691570 RepID=A0ABQ2KD06_9NOCA|nr:recombinase family protein [Nocardia rhizosphaerihabitans]GGN78749.1 hypothetical protein GCM10011610_26620 [Nocardia rhizosphaerihabitans]
MQRIFRLYLDGRGDRAIATDLNRENIPCPSAHRPEQNRHRSGDGWQATTVAAILQNLRYTGYAIFGRWTKTEQLLDPDDVAAGHIVKFKRSPAQRIVRSGRPAHPAIVSVETFTQATLERKKRAGTGNRARGRLERTRPITTANVYQFRGRIHCDICNRKMQGEMHRKAVYYRCRGRSLAPGSPVQGIHPATVDLREADIIEPINDWLSTLFHPDHLDSTIAALLDAQDDSERDTRRASLRRRIDQASTRIERHLAAIEAGVDPQAVVGAMNSAQADKAAAQVELDNLPTEERLTETELRKIIESYGDVRLILAGGAPEHTKELYNAIELQIRYAHLEHRMTITTSPVGDSTGVRRGTRPLRTPTVPTDLDHDRLIRSR